MMCLSTFCDHPSHGRYSDDGDDDDDGYGDDGDGGAPIFRDYPNHDAHNSHQQPE